MAGLYTVHDFALLIADVTKIFVPSLNHGFYYALGATCCLLLYGYYNYRHPQVNKIDVSLDKPIEGNGINIVAVSDVHLGYGTGKAMLKEYVDMINAQHPDLILIGGDLIDNSLTPLYKENMAEELAQLKAPLGIYMVPGNHEYISGIDESVRFRASSTCRITSAGTGKNRRTACVRRIPSRNSASLTSASTSPQVLTSNSNSACAGLGCR